MPERIIFVSHASADRPYIELLAASLQDAFAGYYTLYATSIPETIPPGADWLDEIFRHITDAAFIFALITPNSITRPWLWFEMGIAWSQHKLQKTLLPVCYGVPAEALKPPLSPIQATFLEDEASTLSLYKRLKDNPDKIGNATLAKVRALQKKLNKITRQLQQVDPMTLALDNQRQAFINALQQLIDTNALSDADLNVFNASNLLNPNELVTLRRRGLRRKSTS